jgi:uncharacterized protein
MKLKALTLLFLVLLFANCFAVMEEDELEIFAVTDDGKALSAVLKLSLKPGSGRVWTRIEPLVGTSTQTTEKIAVQLAEKYSEQAKEYDFFFEIESSASLVEGPSAGAAMTLLAISMLRDKAVPNTVSLTGTITAEGGIGPVGGVFEKSGEAARIGIQLFMIPSGEMRQTVKIDRQVQSINLADYAYQNWGMKVVEVKNIDEVLQYAFSDVEAIDVSTGSDSGADFVPSMLELNDNLEPMKTLTANYITEAEAAVRSAGVALSGTMLDDPTVIDSLLTYLNESEKTLEKSKILYEQNYLYSSANFSFLAMVNSNFVRDLAENPDLLSSTSPTLNEKVKALDKEIDSLAIDLNRFVSVDFFEWQVASKERLAWAKLKVNSLQENNEIVIIVEQNGINVEKFSDLLDYEYAFAWYNVSRDFFDLAKNSKRAVLFDEGLVPKLDSLIANSENSLTALSDEESEDIVRRLDSAKLAYKSGWIYSALFDAASAHALANAAIFSKNQGLDELQSVLDQRLELLEQKMADSKFEYVWARLYFDHAHYFLDSSLFYEEQGRLALALTNVKNGIDLVFLAEGIFDATESSYGHFETLPVTSFVQPNILTTEGFPFKMDLIYIFVFVIALLLALMLFGIIASGKKFHILKPFSFEDMLEDVLWQQRRLRKRLENGHLTNVQFNTLDAPLQKRVNKLILERRAVSADYVALDLNKSKVLAFQRALRELRIQFNKKNITAEDYTSNVDFYKKKIALLKHLIRDEDRKIQAEKKRAEKTLSLDKPKKEKKNPRQGKRN